VATIYNIGRSTLSRWLKPPAAATSKNRKTVDLHSVIGGIVKRTIESKPFSGALDVIKAVREACGKSVSQSSIYRSLKRLRFSHKRASRSRDYEAAPLGHPFMADKSYDGNPIAVDESSFYWNDVPKMGWAPKGKRVGKARPTRRTRVSILLAVGMEGVVSFKVVQGGVKSPIFADFIKTLPDDRPLILDNCSIHKTIAVKALCCSKGSQLRFIPPYCPWYNPVEFCFSEIKRAYRPIRLNDPSSDFVEDVRACVSGLRHHASYFQHAQRLYDQDRAPR